MYNGAAYLAETIASILSQDFSDFELLISDNASTDATPEIAEEFARRDSRIRVTRNDRNIGSAGNFNRVFRLTAGVYFKWACADDRVAPGFLTPAIADLEASPSVVLSYGRTTMVDTEGTALGEYAQGLDLRMSDVATRFCQARGRTGLLNVLQGVMRRAALERTALIGAFPGSDEALVVELALYGPFHEIEAPMLFRRFHPQAASASKSVVERQDHLDPASAGRLFSYRWRHATTHVQAILRAPLSPVLKARLAGIVIRTMIMQRDEYFGEVKAVLTSFTRMRRTRSRAARP